MKQKTQLWRVKIYRGDSQTTVIYENVKHAWWNRHGVFVISQLRDPDQPEHDYIEWPQSMIDHLKVERM